MRIYAGGPRPDFGEVPRPIGPFPDPPGWRDVLLVDTPGGLIPQGPPGEGGTGAHP